MTSVGMIAIVEDVGVVKEKFIMSGVFSVKILAIGIAGIVLWLSMFLFLR